VGDQRRPRPEIVGLLGEEMPDQDGHLACCREGSDLVAAPDADAQEKARRGPGALAAAHAASTRRARACARPILLIRPCCARPSPDCRTRGLRPK
jgi:hypothetical protein